MSWLVGGSLPSLVLGLAAFLGGCGDSTAAESGATRIVRVDERKGSVQGVRLGDSLSEVKRRLPGGVEADPRTSRTLPLVGELEELGLPGIIDPPREGTPIERFGLLRYRHLSITFAPPTGAFVIKIAIPGARTLAGVGLGDPLEAARGAYPDMRCDVQNRNSEYVAYPYCTTKLENGFYIWFGQDPIRSITLSSTPL